MQPPERLNILVTEASNLRDYLLHVQGHDGEILGAALRPFERDGSDAPPTDKEISALRAAFQKSHDGIVRHIDSYTVNEVLRGRSPIRHRTPLATSIALTFVGALLVAMAFQYTYWSNQAAAVLVRADNFVQFDHFPRLSKLIELKHYFEQVEQNANTKDLEPQLLYLEGLSSLQRHYLEEATLPGAMTGLLAEENAVMGIWLAIQDRACPQPEFDDTEVEQETGTTFGTVVAKLLNCPTMDDLFFEEFLEPDPSAEPDDELSAGLGDEFLDDADDKIGDTEAQEEIVYSAFEQRRKFVDNLRLITMEEAKRDVVGFYEDTQHYVQGLSQQLRERLKTVHLWILPIIYGALGSIVYCMWRVLNPNVAPLGIIYSFMRTIFAGLAALTLSMLLVPSNILTAGVELNRPLIYLLSFIFGYSVEVFINTLNLLNTYFLQNITSRPKVTGGR